MRRSCAIFFILLHFNDLHSIHCLLEQLADLLLQLLLGTPDHIHIGLGHRVLAVGQLAEAAEGEIPS